MIPAADLWRLSTGDMFRGVTPSSSATLQEGAAHMAAGNLVPDEIIWNAVRERLQQVGSWIRV